MNNNFNIVEALTQIAREKDVDRELVVNTLTDALISAAKKRYGNSDNYEVELDASTGTMVVKVRKLVVEEVEEPETQINLDDAREIDPKIQLGSLLYQELNLADFGRNAIQTAKQVLIQRVREAERERIHDEFNTRVGTIESGTVQQISHGDIVLNLGRAEAAVPYKEQIRRERYRQGDSVRGYIYEILKSTRGPQILLSRSRPEFLDKLFALEVPEIAEGIVTVHAVAREPGERAKIAVSSNDDRVDPVGACVGVKGSRVQTIVRELSGERIDIVNWSIEPEVFVMRALSPADVQRVVLDHRRHHAVVIVNEDQLSLAIGKSGQNSRLAVQLTGWGLDIISEDEYQKRRVKMADQSQVLLELPGVSELVALGLSTSGFNTVESVAESTVELLQTVPGLEESAEKIKNAAIAYLAHPKEETADSEAITPSEEEAVESEAIAPSEEEAVESEAIAPSAVDSQENSLDEATEVEDAVEPPTN
jgi:transcription termination/antitermination protein NusA